MVTLFSLIFVGHKGWKRFSKTGTVEHFRPKESHWVSKLHHVLMGHFLSIGYVSFFVQKSWFHFILNKHDQEHCSTYAPLQDFSQSEVLSHGML